MYRFLTAPMTDPREQEHPLASPLCFSPELALLRLVSDLVQAPGQHTVQSNLNPQTSACNVQTALEHENILLPPALPPPKPALKSQGFLSQQDPS